MQADRFADLRTPTNAGYEIAAAIMRMLITTKISVRVKPRFIAALLPTSSSAKPPSASRWRPAFRPIRCKSAGPFGLRGVPRDLPSGRRGFGPLDGPVETASATGSDWLSEKVRFEDKGLARRAWVPRRSACSRSRSRQTQGAFVRRASANSRECPRSEEAPRRQSGHPLPLSPRSLQQEWSLADSSRS